MRLSFNVTGEDRKRLVKVIEKSTGLKAKYMRVPTCAYRIGAYEVTKEGQLVFENSVDADSVIDDCVMAGFEPEEWDKNLIEDEEPADAPDSVKLSISVPLDDVNVENLENLLKAKEELITHALGVESLPFVLEEDKVSFPWFESLPDADHIAAYTHFIEALCKMTREQKRINAGGKTVSNEKYAFRCFLLRLGFIGDESKKERKILLSNLSGSSAFKEVKEA